MPKAQLLDMAGNKQREIELDAAVWSVEADDQLLSEYVRYHDASGRRHMASTKTRNEVRGGGAKPWRQKGTGRARHGSSRSPIWTGGGVTFGPRSDRNCVKQMNKKARRKALAAILTAKFVEGKVLFVSELAMDKPSTKEFDKFLERCGIQGTALVVSAEPTMEILYSARNLRRAKVLSSDRINPHDLLKYEFVVLDAGAVDALEKGMGLK